MILVAIVMVVESNHAEGGQHHCRHQGRNRLAHFQNNFTKHGRNIHLWSVFVNVFTEFPESIRMIADHICGNQKEIPILSVFIVTGRNLLLTQAKSKTKKEEYIVNLKKMPSFLSPTPTEVDDLEKD